MHQVHGMVRKRRATDAYEKLHRRATKGRGPAYGVRTVRQNCQQPLQPQELPRSLRSRGKEEIRRSGGGGRTGGSSRPTPAATPRGRGQEEASRQDHLCGSSGGHGDGTTDPALKWISGCGRSRPESLEPARIVICTSGFGAKEGIHEHEERHYPERNRHTFGY